MKPELEPRYGTVIINDNFVASNPLDVMQVMARMVVVRAEHRFATMDFEYVAWSPEFEVSDVCVPPVYVALFELVDGESMFMGFRKEGE